MTSRKLLIANFGHSQIHSLGKVGGTEVMEAFDLSNIYCILGLSGANEAMVDDGNHHPWRHLSEGSLSGDQTGRVVGLADSHRDILAPLPLLSDLLQLEQWPFYLLGLSWGQKRGRLIFQPTYLLL